MIDNVEVNEVLEILESMDDETLATTLLFEFNEKTKSLGQLILNKDQGLDHKEWKNLCDVAQGEVDAVVKRILSHK